MLTEFIFKVEKPTEVDLKGGKLLVPAGVYTAISSFGKQGWVFKVGCGELLRKVSVITGCERSRFGATEHFKLGFGQLKSSLLSAIYDSKGVDYRVDDASAAFDAMCDDEKLISLPRHKIKYGKTQEGLVLGYWKDELTGTTILEQGHIALSEQYLDEMMSLSDMVLIRLINRLRELPEGTMVLPFSNPASDRAWSNRLALHLSPTTTAIPAIELANWLENLIGDHLVHWKGNTCIVEGLTRVTISTATKARDINQYGGSKFIAAINDDGSYDLRDIRGKSV